MSGKTPTQDHVEESPQTPDADRISEARMIMDRAQQGDRSVLPELQRLLDEHPVLWQKYGNVAAIARLQWIDLMSGSNLLMKESIDRFYRAEVMKLCGSAPPPLEKLLAERIAVCRMQLAHAESMLAQSEAKLTPKLAATLDKRISQCQKRLSAAIRDLDRHWKLLGRTAPPAHSSSSAPEPSVTASEAVPGETSAHRDPQEVVKDTAVDDQMAGAMRDPAESQETGPDETDQRPRNGFHNRLHPYLASSPG